MKKQMLALGLLAGVVAMMGTGCINYEASKVGQQVAVNMPVLVKPDIVTKNTLIEGEATVNCLFGLITWGVDSQAVGVNYGVPGTEAGILPLPDPNAVARNGAAWDATKKGDADIILAPRYEVTTEDYFVFKKINCKVKGYPGNIKGVTVVDCPPPPAKK